MTVATSFKIDTSILNSAPTSCRGTPSGREKCFCNFFTTAFLDIACTLGSLCNLDLTHLAFEIGNLQPSGK